MEVMIENTVLKKVMPLAICIVMVLSLAAVTAKAGSVIILNGYVQGPALWAEPLHEDRHQARSSIKGGDTKIVTASGGNWAKTFTLDGSLLGPSGTASGRVTPNGTWFIWTFKYGKLL